MRGFGLVWLLAVAACDSVLHLDAIHPPDAPAARRWISVAAGAAHSCAVDTGGALWCWGNNDLGELGLGFTPEIDDVTRVGAASWLSVTSAHLFTCGIQSDHSLWCWGRDDAGQIGVGNLGFNNEVPEPEQVDGTWQSVATGNGHACAIRDDGSLWCWGNNSYGQLGDQAIFGLIRPSPVPVGPSGTTWTAVAAGWIHSCAIASDTALWCWGDNVYGELGSTTTSGTQPTPIQVPGTGWTKVATGYSQTCGIASGHLYCWGYQLRPAPMPRTLFGADLDGWVDVAINGADTANPIGCAQRADGVWWCFGDNRRGQLGPAGATIALGSSEPVPLQGGPRALATIAVGEQHTCGLGGDGTLWCLGSDGHGELGDGGSSRRTPAKVSGSGWSKPAAGLATTCALDAGQLVECTGANDDGECGDGTFVDHRELARVVGAVPARSIAAGTDHMCAIGVDASLWCWGFGAYGQLGDNTSQSHLTPTQIQAGTSWTAVSAADQTCAIDSVGGLWCWGYNADYEVGNGSMANVPAPIPIAASLAPWTALAAGPQHTCAQSAQGARCWGNGFYGEMGNGMAGITAPTPTPQLAGLSYASVVSGLYDSCGIVAGTRQAVCWGYGQYGQLGVGGLGELLAPTPVPNHVWRELASGSIHTCGIDMSGALWCWGDNRRGQLGDGTLESRDTPTPVGDPADHTWQDVTAGATHTCATKLDGSLWCWGANDAGQLGDGTAWRAQLVEIP